ncbi:MAG: hypothetical protein ACI8S7_001246, partial [Candidatus Krumholzibacteriia bacterium]
APQKKAFIGHPKCLSNFPNNLTRQGVINTTASDER